MSQKAVKPSPAVLAGMALSLAVDMPGKEFAVPCPIFSQSLRNFLFDPVAISEHRSTGAPARQMDRHVIRRQYAIAIDEEQIRRHRRLRPFVAAARYLKRGVLMRREIDREIDAAAKLCDDLGRFIRRAVVGHHDLDLSLDSPLPGDRR